MQTDAPNTPPNQPTPRRRLLALWAAATASAAVSTPGHAATAHSASPPTPFGEAKHKIVFQLNQADEHYQTAILNSISALLTQYVDDIAIAVVVWGPGIHLLAKTPQRPVPPLLQQRVRSMAEAYGVRFIGCGNTMQTVGWTRADMQDFIEVEHVGVGAVMELQEQGYAYLAW